MRRMAWAVYLWPGLPQLARRGSWAALVVAIGAGAMLQVALLGTFVWTELLSPELRILYWVLLLIAWGVSAVLSGWLRDRESARSQGDENRDIFHEALDHYLQGRWVEAERGARPVVAKGPPRRGSPLDAGHLVAAHAAMGRSGPATRRPGSAGRGPEMGSGNPPRGGTVGRGPRRRQSARQHGNREQRRDSCTNDLPTAPGRSCNWPTRRPSGSTTNTSAPSTSSWA